VTDDEDKQSSARKKLSDAWEKLADTDA